MASATFGLVLGGLIGGPVTKRLVERFQLTPSAPPEVQTRDVTYAYDDQQSGSARQLIYFDAELRLLQDRKLADWDKLNVGSLISVLGARPKGISGVRPGGNRKGDRLAVHGSAAFADTRKGWKPVAFLPGAARKRSGPCERAEQPHHRQIERLEQLGLSFQRAGAHREMKWLTEQLDQLRAAAERRLGMSEGWLTIATGGPSGEYQRQGRALAAVLERVGHRARAYSTSGSAENCALVQRREVAFAYSQNDVAHMAHSGGKLPRHQLPMRDLRALCSLYPEAVQIVTLRSAGIRSVAGLRGKRVDVGVRGSGVRVNALAVLRAAGLGLHDLAAVRGRGLPGAAEDLSAGKVDAFFLTHTFPVPLVRELAQSVELKLLPVDGDLLATLRRDRPSLLPIELPRRTYPGVTAPVPTVQVTAMLITHKDTPGGRVQLLLRQLFANVEQLSRGSAQAYFISPGTARNGSPSRCTPPPCAC